MSTVWAVVRFDGPNGPESYDWPAGATQPGSPYLSVKEALEVEKVTGDKPRDWMRALSEMEPTAWTALVMILRRRDGQDVRFSDVDFDLFSAQLLDVDERGNVVEPGASGDEAEAGDQGN